MNQPIHAIESRARAHQEPTRAPQQFAQEFALPMQDMGPGSYVVEWRGLGADGHALNGTFNFTVKQ